MRSMISTRRLYVGLFLQLVSALSLHAQAGTQTGAPDQRTIVDYAHAKPYVLVDETPRMQQGDWHEDGRLWVYAKANPGRYIAFVSDGLLYRIDAPAAVQRALALYAPLRVLGNAQSALGAQQKPLGEQQQTLSAQQQAASDPATKYRIGSVQGQIGAVQGAIGHQQGILGQQQGALGEQFFQEMEAMIASSMKEGTCRHVDDTARR